MIDDSIRSDKPYSRKKLFPWTADRSIELILSFAITFFAAAQLFVSCDNNASTGKQTDQLIAAAKLSAYAAQQNLKASQNFAASAQGINQGVRNAVVRLQQQASEAELARESFEARSRDSLDQTIHAFSLDQRAWISVFPEDSVTQQGNLPFHRVESGIRNTGKTPAHDVIACFGNYSKQIKAVPGPAEDAWMNSVIDKVRSSVIKPGSPLITPRQPSSGMSERLKKESKAKQDEELRFFHALDPPPDLMLPVEIFGKFSAEAAPRLHTLGSVAPQSVFPLVFDITGNFLSGSSFMEVIYGSIFYKDDFKVEHTTTFCLYALDASRPSWDSCPVHNDIN